MQLPVMERFELESAQVGDRLEVAVTVPPGPAQTGPLPVIYVLDPAFNFHTVAAAAGWLAMASRLADGAFPAAIVAGVGAVGDDLGAMMARRARDLTPTSGPPPDGLSLPPLPLGAGGATEFLEAILSEVAPRVEAEFGADPEDRTLVGHSFGGLFGLFTLFRRPLSFRRYLVISPSLWWDDGIVLRDEQAWADEHADLPARLFLAVGGNEQTPGADWRNEGFPDEAIAAARQVDNCRELWRRLEDRRYPSLALDGAVMDGEYHLTIQAAAITRGLVSLFC